MTKRIICVAAAAIACAALVPATAQAARSKVTISSYSGGSWIGQVDSNKNSCINGRKVTLYRKQSGADVKIGADGSDSGKGDTEGVWRIPDMPLAGTYYAKVKAKNSCDKDTSKDYDFPEDQP